MLCKLVHNKKNRLERLLLGFIWDRVAAFFRNLRIFDVRINHKNSLICDLRTGTRKIFFYDFWWRNEPKNLQKCLLAYLQGVKRESVKQHTMLYTIYNSNNILYHYVNFVRKIFHFLLQYLIFPWHFFHYTLSTTKLTFISRIMALKEIRKRWKKMSLWKHPVGQKTNFGKNVLKFRKML